MLSSGLRKKSQETIHVWHGYKTSKCKYIAIKGVRVASTKGPGGPSVRIDKSPGAVELAAQKAHLRTQCLSHE